jgi:hypothetical protein
VQRRYRYPPGTEGTQRVLYTRHRDRESGHLDAWWIEDCGCCGPSASDVSQRVGTTSRSRLSGGRESNIDFQNLPVTGLLAPPSRFAGIVHEDLLFTSHRSGRSGDISSLSPRSCSPMQPLIIPKHRDTSRSCPIYIHPRVVNRSNNVTHVRTDYVSWR